MNIKQYGGSFILIPIIIISIFLSIACYFFTSCNNNNCSNLVNLSSWNLKNESNNSIILEKTCENKYSFLDKCKDISSSVLTKTVAVTPWSFSNESNNNIQLIRSCNSSDDDCKLIDNSKLTKSVTVTPWSFSNESNNNIQLIRSCSSVDDCKLIDNSKLTKSFSVTPWKGSLDNNLSGTINRGCYDNQYCNLVTTTKTLTMDNFKKYPPSTPSVDVTNNSISFNGITIKNYIIDISSNSYGNGKYEVRASSSFSTTMPVDAFISNPRNTFKLYHSEANRFDPSTGLPTTNASSINGIKGEYLYIKLPIPIKLTAYTIYPRGDSNNPINSYLSRSPKEFIIFGSNDDNTWKIVDDRRNSNATSDWTIDPKSFYIDNKIAYKSYILLTTKVGNNNVNASRNCVNIERWDLFEEI